MGKSSVPTVRYTPQCTVTFRCIAHCCTTRPSGYFMPAIPRQKRERPYETCADTVRLAGHARPQHRRLQGRRAAVPRQPDRGGRATTSTRTADETIDATDKIVMPGLVNAHMHTWETALRGIGADWMSPDYSGTCTPIWRRATSRRTTTRQPDGRAGADRRRRAPRWSTGATTSPTIEHAERAVDGLIDSGIRAVFAHGTAKPPTAEGDRPFTDSAASARAHRNAAQGPAGGRRRPRHARDGDPRSGLGQLGGGRARHPHGARARTGVVVAYTTARGLRRARRLRAHGQGGTARAGPQSRAWHELRRSADLELVVDSRRVAHVDRAGRAASPHRRHAGGGVPRRRRPAVARHRRRTVLQRQMFREMQAALLFARGKEIRNNALRGNSPFRQLPVRSREALEWATDRRRARLFDGRQDRHAVARQEGRHRHAARRRHQHGAGVRSRSIRSWRSPAPAMSTP